MQLDKCKRINLASFQGIRKSTETKTSRLPSGLSPLFSEMNLAIVLGLFAPTENHVEILLDEHNGRCLGHGGLALSAGCYKAGFSSLLCPLCSCFLPFLSLLYQTDAPWKSNLILNLQRKVAEVAIMQEK